MILVTGATGTIGRELVPQLLAQSLPVRALTRDARKVAHLGDQVEVAVGDLDRPETLAAAMRGDIAPRDVAAVAALALTQPGHTDQVYELSGPELLSIGEMVQVLARALGRPLKYVDIPLFAAGLFMRTKGMDKVLVNALMELADTIRKNKAAQRTNTVQQLTSRPAQTFAAWCGDHIVAFRQSNGRPSLDHNTGKLN